jgi:hypothetical protein
MGETAGMVGNAIYSLVERRGRNRVLRCSLGSVGALDSLLGGGTDGMGQMVVAVAVNSPVSDAVLSGKRAKALPRDDGVFNLTAAVVFAQDAGAGHFAPSFTLLHPVGAGDAECGVRWIAVSKSLKMGR